MSDPDALVMPNAQARHPAARALSADVCSAHKTLTARHRAPTVTLPWINAVPAFWILLPLPVRTASRCSTAVMMTAPYSTRCTPPATSDRPALTVSVLALHPRRMHQQPTRRLLILRLRIHLQPTRHQRIHLQLIHLQHTLQARAHHLPTLLQHTLQAHILRQPIHRRGMDLRQ